MSLLRFSEVSRLLIQSKDALVKQTGDYYATSTIRVYAGGPYELNIDYCNSDEGMFPLFYVSFDCDDAEIFTGTSLRKAVKDLFKVTGYLREFQADFEGLEVEVSEIQNLEDIIADDHRIDEECCSAEFQRMAPAHMINLFEPGVERKKHKKDKYNRLGV